MRFVSGYIGAVLVAYLVGAISGTQFVLQAVSDMGLAVGFDQRLGSTIQDLQGLASTYLPLVAVAMLIGMVVAGQLARLLPAHRTLLYVAAGFVALVAMHMIMKAVLGLTGFAPARTVIGLLSQGLAGACGGLMFARISARTDSAPQR